MQSSTVEFVLDDHLEIERETCVWPLILNIGCQISRAGEFDFRRETGEMNDALAVGIASRIVFLELQTKC